MRRVGGGTRMARLRTAALEPIAAGRANALRNRGEDRFRATSARFRAGSVKRAPYFWFCLVRSLQSHSPHFPSLIQPSSRRSLSVHAPAALPHRRLGQQRRLRLRAQGLRPARRRAHVAPRDTRRLSRSPEPNPPRKILIPNCLAPARNF